MNASLSPGCTAFDGPRRIASGPLIEVACAAKRVVDANPAATLQIFDNATSEPVEIDLRGTQDDVLARLGAGDAARDTHPQGRKGPGRPRLGVVAREVTLLPRHWDWLREQPGGASVALRKLVEAGMRESGERDRTRRAREAAYRFMTAMAGNEAGFEEAIRALFAGDRGRFVAWVAAWPPDVRDHAIRLAFPEGETASQNDRK